MIQLTYISTALRGLADGDVADILASSRRNNSRDGLTGLLLHDGRRFLQALEGPQAMVETTYARIKADSRHRALVLLGSREIGERHFGHWAMACERVATGPLARGIEEQVDTLTASLADANMRELFRGFARVRAAA